MEFFKKFLKKEEEAETQEEFHIDENGNQVESSIEEITYTKNKCDIKTLIGNLNLEEVYEAKELIDKRLEELHQSYGLSDSNTKVEEIPVKPAKKEISEQEIEEHVDEDYLNDETVEIEGDMPINDEYLEFGEEEKTQEKQIEEVAVKKVEEEEILDKLKAYFGEENIFQETRNDLKHEALKGKEVYCIGIRAREAFNDDSFDMLKQNSWFIRNIKKLDELKSFKMINSSNVEKNLVWDKGDHAILICYKAINVLKGPNEFNFN